MNEETIPSSTHRGVNQPSRVGVLPNMPRSDVAAVSVHTEEYEDFLCTFLSSFFFLDLERHDFPPLFIFSFESEEFVV
jgi:hypothetical protein